MSRLSLTTVVVPDYDEAIAWFTRALRFELVEDTRLSDTKRWVVVKPRGATADGAGLLLARATDDRQRTHVGDQTGGRTALFLESDAFDEDHAHMTAAGVRFLEDVRTEPYGRVVQFADAWGNGWDLLEAQRPRA